MGRWTLRLSLVFKSVINFEGNSNVFFDKDCELVVKFSVTVFIIRL